MSPSLLGYTRVFAGLNRYARMFTSLLEYVRLLASLSGYARVFTSLMYLEVLRDMRRCSKVFGGTCACLHMLSGSKRVDKNLLRYVHVFAKLRTRVDRRLKESF